MQDTRRFSAAVLVLAAIASGSVAVGASSALANGPSKVTSPDTALTPGATDPEVRSDTLNRTICKLNATQRRTATSAALSKQVFARYGISHDRQSRYVVDRLVPLILGGTDDLDNLWPEPKTGPSGRPKKRTIETLLHKRVCDGTIELEAAQQMMVTDWTRVPELITFADKYLELVAPFDALSTDVVSEIGQLPPNAPGGEVAKAAQPLADGIADLNQKLAQVSWPRSVRDAIAALITTNETVMKDLRDPASETDFSIEPWIAHVLADRANEQAAANAVRRSLGLQQI